MRKRILSLILALVITSVTITSASATAAGESFVIDDTQIEQTVTHYLDAYLREAYLYEDTNFAAYSVSTQLMNRSNDILMVKGESITVYEAAKNITYMENKADYFKATRQAQEIYRSDFNVEYIFNSKEISQSCATVNVSAIISFKYDDHDDLSIIEEVFDIALVKISGTWLVADAVEPMDWFDSTYKNDASFDFDQYTQDSVKMLRAEAEIADMLTSSGAASVFDEDNNVYATPLATETSLSYNYNNAVAYAYTYTTSTASSPTTFYNSNFQYFSSDCMNFVSQCIWAGFGGNNNVASIDSHNVPMDTTGQYSYNWFSSSPNNVNVHSTSWSACGSFRTYLERTASDTGLRADIYDIGTGTFASISNWSVKFLGSVLHVPGASVDYGHAVIVTSVSGTNRSQVEYCAHTSMAKAIKVGDSWPTGKIKVIVPTSFTTTQTVQSPRITAIMPKPIPVDTTLSLLARTNVPCYRIRITVTAPNGLSRSGTVYNDKTSATFSYQFSQKGLYTIKVSAQEDIDSTYIDYYYTIRVY